MSKFTKAAIIDAFLKILNNTPFDKITVKDIVDECEINRNTFYYYFEDIYALVDEVLNIEMNKIVSEINTYNSLDEAFLKAADFALKNKNAVYHLHNSVKREQLEVYLHKVFYSVLIKFVRKQAEGVEISEGNISFITEFYEFALTGLISKWLRTGMKSSYEEIVGKVSILFNENIKNAIKCMSKNSDIF